MAEPTDVQLRDYAAKLPQIYKDLLAAIPKIDSNRRSGDPVKVFDIEVMLVSEAKDVRIHDVPDAINQLISQKFLRGVGGYNYCAPTVLGERLITLITNHVPRPASIPALPEPSWVS